jgi:circadian clock protein KaiC
VSKSSDSFAASGIPGLDQVLTGGFAKRRLFLVEGVPGSGKTTLALQFLIAGAAQGESVLYVTLSETEDELRSVAESHGWSLDGVNIRELSSPLSELDGDEVNTMFHPSEVELISTVKPILMQVDTLRPTRVVFDSLSELRLLAGAPLRYRRQILALKQFFATRDCTVMLLDDLTGGDRDLQVQSIAHAVVRLEQLTAEYGTDRRRLRVIKYRGVNFRGGYHDYVIRSGGLTVFPRLVAADHRQRTRSGKRPSNLPELDALLGGGLEEGTSTLIAGASGTGKSTLAAQFVLAGADAGRRAVMYLFDERPDTLLARCASVNIDLRPHVTSGRVELKQVDPAEMSPGELVDEIRTAVEEHNVDMVVIDSLNGYLQSMPGERFLTIQLHELLAFLGQRDVATLLVGTHQGLVGGEMHAPVDTTYLADAVILMRYFETDGEVRQAISVMKQRAGFHERTLREFQLTDGRIRVGEVLRGFRGILTGTPMQKCDET